MDSGPATPAGAARALSSPSTHPHWPQMTPMAQRTARHLRCLRHLRPMGVGGNAFSTRASGRAVHPLAAFRAEASDLLQKAAASLGHTGPLPALESPPDRALGDLGMPCFTLAKAMRKAPNAIAADLAKAVPAAGRSWVASVSAAGPYVNVMADRARMAAAVLRDPAG